MTVLVAKNIQDLLDQLGRLNILEVADDLALEVPAPLPFVGFNDLEQGTPNLRGPFPRDV